MKRLDESDGGKGKCQQPLGVGDNLKSYGVWCQNCGRLTFLNSDHRKVGVEQNLTDAPCDHLGLKG